MYSSGNNKFYFTPNTSAWQNKWVKIIACDKSTNLWSDPVYVKIDFVGPPPPAQTKPRITSPSDRSSSTFEKDVNVTVSGNNIEVTYVGLNGEPNPSNTNESQNGFYTGKMYSSGNNKFYFTPNTSAWQNKWVKIIACDKSTNLWSDPVYVKILGSTPPKSEHGIEILSDKDYSSAFASTAYNPRLAYWCAKAAKDAYDNSNETMKLLGFNPEKLDLAEFDIPVYMLVGMKMTKINVSVGLRGYIGKTTVNGENVVMIAIRGSKTTSNWLSDFNAYPYSWKTELPSIPDNVIPDDNTFSKWIPFLSQASPEAHGGFFLCTQKIWNKIPAHYKNTNNLFIVTGHSLGGAISELLCLKLKDANVPVNNIISYGFASPPVGDEDLRNHAGNLKSKIIKIKSNNDVVPNAGIFAFTLANQVGTITFSDKWAIDIPGNHSMDRYLQEISNLKPPRFTNDFKTVSYSSTPMNQPQSQNSNTSNAPAQPIGTNSNTVTPITTSNSQESTNTNNPNTRGSQVGQRRQGNTNQQQPQTKPLITSPSDRSTFILGNQLDVTVSGNNIEVMYSGLTGNPNPPNENESNFYKGTMYSSCNNNFFFTPNTSTWENKWVKIIARDKNTNLWSDPVYVQILPKQNNQQQQQANNLFQTAQQQQQSENKTSNVPVQSMTIEGNTVSRTTSLYQQENTNARERQDSRQPQRGNTNQQQQQQQTKPQITSPSDRSSIVVGSQLSVTVSGDNIEVTYTGLTGDPNPSNKNERSFERRTMSLSGNNTFFFTPNGLTWENRWVKIVARDKNTNLLSDPVYVKIEQNNQQRGRNQQRDNDNQEDNRRQRGNNNNRR
ncbi:MAG: lipase family protein, partial [Dysgonamonadaceae bacterium]|jgi:hypothetical protein|nr:lipase family protein [Dysgonamonadaceae bacterium]